MDSVSLRSSSQGLPGAMELCDWFCSPDRVSRDFAGFRVCCRRELHRRTRPILWLLTLSVPLWWLVDRHTLPQDFSGILLPYRLLCGAGLLALLAALRFRRAWLAGCLFLTLLMLLSFNVLCQLELTSLTHIPFGYPYFPFMLLLLLAILPLGWRLGALFCSLISMTILLTPFLLRYHPRTDDLALLLLACLVSSAAVLLAQQWQLYRILLSYWSACLDSATGFLKRRRFREEVRLFWQSSVPDRPYVLLRLELSAVAPVLSVESGAQPLALLIKAGELCAGLNWPGSLMLGRTGDYILQVLIKDCPDTVGSRLAEDWLSAVQALAHTERDLDVTCRLGWRTGLTGRDGLGTLDNLLVKTAYRPVQTHRQTSD